MTGTDRMKTLLSAASVCALLITAPAWAQTSGAPAGNGAEPLSQQDRNFIEKAGAGSLAEADLGKLAEQKGATAAIREFGRWMYTDHGLVANNWLKAILAEQQQNFQPTLTAQDKELRRKLESLAGSRFDQEYIQAQVADHEKTIPVFQQEASDGHNPMIKNFAENLIPVLQQHLEEAKALAGGPAVAGSERSGAAARSGSSMPPR
jgi:putative membrane protein